MGDLSHNWFQYLLLLRVSIAHVDTIFKITKVLSKDNEKLSYVNIYSVSPLKTLLLLITLKQG